MDMDQNRPLIRCTRAGHLKRAPVCISSVVGQGAALEPRDGAFAKQDRASKRRVVALQAAIDERESRRAHDDRPRGVAA
eukprot:5068879-Prymnesium_polylepis.1